MTTTYPPLPRACMSFTRSRGDARSPHTLRNYQIALDALLGYLAAACGLDHETTTAHLTSAVPADLYTYLRARGLEQSTARLYAGIARSFCFELSLLGQAPLIEPLVMTDLLRRRLPRQLPSSVSPSACVPAVARYYQDCPLPLPPGSPAHLRLLRDRTLLSVLLATAARCAEATAILRSQVAGGQDEVHVVGKGGTRRTLYLTRDARTTIHDYLAARTDVAPHLFISHGRPARSAQSQPLSSQQVWNIVHTAAVAVGAPDVHPHEFRHFRASAWLSGGLPLELVQELLGHRDIALTRRVYARYLGTTVRERFFGFEDTLATAAAS